MDAEKGSDGRWCWVYITDRGGEYRGARRHKTKKAAVAEGNKWLVAMGWQENQQGRNEQ